MQIFRNLKVAIAALIIVAGMVGISFASASGPESTMVYFGCLHNGSLSSVQIGTPPKCPKGFRLINWNATGPQGVAGPSGSTGPAGASSNYPSISTSSYSIGFGTGALTIGTGLAWTTGQTVLIAADQSHYVIATVVSYDSATGVMNFSVGNTPGSVVGGGTFSSWTVNLSGPVGQAGYSGSDGTPGDSTVYKRTNNDIVLSTSVWNSVVVSTQNYFIVAISNQIEKISYNTGQVIDAPLTISTGNYNNGNVSRPYPINSISVSGNILWAETDNSIYEISISNWAVIGSPISAPVNPMHAGTCSGSFPIASDINGAYTTWDCGGSSAPYVYDSFIFEAISNTGVVVMSHTYSPALAVSVVTGTNNNVWLSFVSVNGCSNSGFGCTGAPSVIHLNSVTLELTTLNTGSGWSFPMDSYTYGPYLFVIGSNVFISKFDVWNEYDQTGAFIKTIGLNMGSPQCSIGNVEYFLHSYGVTAINTSSNGVHSQGLFQGGGQLISTPTGALWLLDTSGSLEQLVPVSF